MSFKKIVAFVVVFAVIIGVGGYFLSKHVEKQKFEATISKLCDYVDAHQENMHFTEDEYESLSKVSYMPWPRLNYAMNTKPFRVAILDKLNSLVAQKDYAQLVDVICYLKKNDFDFVADDNNFDILFGASDLKQISDYIIENNSGVQEQNGEMIYEYKGNSMRFARSGLLSGVTEAASDFDYDFFTDSSWKGLRYRSKKSIQLGQEFCEENLGWSDTKEDDEDYTVSDYLKDNAPDLYDSIKDRYESLA